MGEEQRSPVCLPVEESPTLDTQSPRPGAPPDSPHGRFLPGTIFGGRYRVIELLGRGGMGEVYRADDLEVGQTVALKFLPPSVVSDEIALARLRNEVRFARQVSHPNVCRVFDLGHLEDRYFLSMEYVDGEDLSSVLRRMGRPSTEKAVQIARQICAGVAAAHATGVLHRDLKPANIMLDGRGRVRLMDFGLSYLAGEAETATEFVGTPIYMAPEQLEGAPASVRTDIYALGAVLYELMTGTRPYPVVTIAELRRVQRSGTAPLPPSQQASGVNSAYDHVILQCLEMRPQARPASAAEVAAALGSENALQEAIAAGETPAPELLAAAGSTGVLSVRVAGLLLASVALLLLSAAWLAKYATVIGRSDPEKSPEVLMDRAREIIKATGVPAANNDSAYGTFHNGGYVRYLAQEHDWRNWTQQLREAPGPLRFWYRQSPQPLIPSDQGGVVGETDPPVVEPGMVNVLLDAHGRLRTFWFVPPLSEPREKKQAQVDWAQLFNAAGFDPRQFVEAEPQWIPKHALDFRISWDGKPNGVPVHIDAAAFHGVPVDFDVGGPWYAPSVIEAQQRTQWIWDFQAAAQAIVAFLVLGAGLVLVRMNLRAGRADRRGAARVALYALFGLGIAGILGAHWPHELSRFWAVFSKVAGNVTFGAGFVWLSYLALDPFARRYWPDLLISWNRLLAGRVRDPLVGRDVLIGVAAGCVQTLLWYGLVTLTTWIRMPEVTPSPGFDTAFLGSPAQALSVVVYKAFLAVIIALACTLILVLARLLLHNKLLALLAAWIGMTFLLNFRIDGVHLILFALVSAMLFLLLLVRFGILAFGISILIVDLIYWTALTLDMSRWYAGRSIAIVLLVLGIAVYGSRCAIGKKPLLSELLRMEQA